MDTCGVCSEGNSGHVADSNIDCNDECFGDALVDECGECQVSYCYDYVTHQVNFDFPCDGPTEMYVVPDNPQNPYWNGSMDECGVCFGDDLSCATVDVSYGVIDNGSFIDGSLGVIEVLYNSTVDVHGFQFNLDGVSLTGGSSDIGNLSALFTAYRATGCQSLGIVHWNTSIYRVPVHGEARQTPTVHKQYLVG